MKLTIIGEPVPKQRPRINTKTGNVYTPEETRAYEALVRGVAQAAALTEGVYPADERLEVELHFFCTPRPRQKVGDIDNLIKSVLDGIEKSGLIPNDRAIVRVVAQRHECPEGLAPKTEIKIRYMP